MRETTLLDAQEDLYQRALADEFLSTIAILKRDEGDISADIIDALGTFNKRGGKIGACVIALQPVAEPGEGEVAGGILKINFTFMVLEDPTINLAAGGTEIRALTIARRLVALFHFYHPRGIIGQLSMDAGTIVPVDGPTPVAYEVRFTAQEDLFTATLKVARPTITPASGASPQSVTLASSTSGASIYYTLDGSHPYAGNSAAVLYSGPVSVTAAATLRACAFKTGLIASDVNAANFS